MLKMDAVCLLGSHGERYEVLSIFCGSRRLLITDISCWDSLDPDRVT